jgi:hypothetical protein
LPNCIERRAAPFHKDQARHKPGSAQSASAMDHDFLSFPEAVVDLGSDSSPAFFESPSGNIHIANGQVNPPHPQLLNTCTKVANFEKLEFMGFKQSQNGTRTPIENHAQVLLEVSVQTSRNVLFPGA